MKISSLFRIILCRNTENTQRLTYFSAFHRNHACTRTVWWRQQTWAFHSRLKSMTVRNGVNSNNWSTLNDHCAKVAHTWMNLVCQCLPFCPSCNTMRVDCLEEFTPKHQTFCWKESATQRTLWLLCLVIRLRVIMGGRWPQKICQIEKLKKWVCLRACVKHFCIPMNVMRDPTQIELFSPRDILAHPIMSWKQNENIWLNKNDPQPLC